VTSLAVIIGADECGYGSWAGPLVAAAVAYPATRTTPPAAAVRNRRIEVCDSKKLKPEAIHALAEAARMTCLCFERHTYTAQEVDFWGVNVAKLRLLRMVVARLLERLNHVHQVEGGVRVVVDGDTNLYPCDFIYDAVPHADATVWQVSAASIIAKQQQLQEMQTLHARHPVYGWDLNAGYGTKNHREALKKFGVSPYHRRSFAPIRRLLPTPDGVEE
jgi:ribonuclease HII